MTRCQPLCLAGWKNTASEAGRKCRMRLKTWYPQCDTAANLNATAIQVSHHVPWWEGSQVLPVLVACRRFSDIGFMFLALKRDIFMSRQDSVHVGYRALYRFKGVPAGVMAFQGTDSHSFSYFAGSCQGYCNDIMGKSHPMLGM